MIPLKDAIVSCAIVNAGNYKNRAGRSEFWQFILFLFFSFACFYIYHTIFGFNTLVILSCSAWGLWLLNVAAIRRLHDVGSEGWLILVFWFAIICFVEILFYSNPNYRRTLLLCSFVILIFLGSFILCKLLTQGSDHDNKYGVARTIRVDASNYSQYKISKANGTQNVNLNKAPTSNKADN